MTLPRFHPVRLIATWFGSGDLPKAPGTWGSLAALPFAWAMLSFGPNWLLPAASLVAYLVGIRVSQLYANSLGRPDPGPVVIDEVAGQWLTLVPLGFTSQKLFGCDLWGYAAGFALFRLFDIVKVWPANWMDSNLKGGLGIMSDDMVAGLYGAICLGALLMLL